MNDKQMNKIFDGDWKLAQEKMKQIEKLISDLKVLHNRIECSLRFAVLDQVYPNVDLPLRVDSSLKLESSLILMEET